MIRSTLILGCFVLPLLTVALAGCGDSSKSEATITLTDENFEEMVLKSPQPVLVDFRADWCGPCRQMDPVIKQIAKKYAGKAVVGKLNIDDNPEITRKYKITGIPAFLIFKDGRVIEEFVGVTSRTELVEALEGLL